MLVNKKSDGMAGLVTLGRKTPGLFRVIKNLMYLATTVLSQILLRLVWTERHFPPGLWEGHRT